jgi:SAM-dependent methyltransferase
MCEMQPAVDYTIVDQQRMTRARKYFRWQRDLVVKEIGRRVVEVGCGLGNFTQFLLDREQVIALDVEQKCIDRVLERFPGGDNLRALVLDASDRRFRELKSFLPDSCVCLNVLEHIENDRLALENMAAILPRGGRIVLVVPAHPALYGPIDRNLGHFRRYSKSSFRALSAKVGLTVRKLHYTNFVGFFGWWANARVFRKEAQSIAQISFFDDWIVPVMSRLEQRVHPPLGQSLFAVLERTS